MLNQAYTKTYKLARRRHPAVDRQPYEPTGALPLREPAQRYVCVEPDIHKKRIEKRIAMRAGELPLELILMKAKGCIVILRNNEPGFTLPSNIDELGDDITKLDLSYCSLHGAFVEPDIYKHSRARAQAPSRRRSVTSRTSRSSFSTKTSSPVRVLNQAYTEAN